MWSNQAAVRPPVSAGGASPRARASVPLACEESTGTDHDYMTVVSPENTTFGVNDPGVAQKDKRIAACDNTRVDVSIET
jgi:hypothetical protein